MKTTTNIRFCTAVLIGLLLFITGACKKDSDTDTSGQVPTVTTSSVTDITSNSATCGGNVTAQGSDAVTARGVCWGTSANPTVNGPKTIDSIGTGSFTSLVSGLSDTTLYYVRAYATNSKGTGYGETMSFTTHAVSGLVMNFQGGGSYVSGDVTLNIGAQFNVGINAYSDVNLTYFEIVRTFNNVPYLAFDSSLNSKTFNLQIIAEALSFVGAERWTFKVTDARGDSKELQFVITTENIGEINTYTAILIGGQLNPDIGSFYATLDNDVMTRGEADLNQSKVDLIYYYGNSNLASIVAPASGQLASVPEFSYITDAVNTDHWTVTNQTKFKTVTGIVWDDITNDLPIKQYATDLVEMNVNQLEAGDIIAFETAATSANAGKKGLFKVVAISGTSATQRTITIEVKIQK